MKKGVVIHLNKLEFPSPTDTLCKVWLKLTQLFWRRRFLNFINVPGIFAFFCYHLPSEKGAILHCNKLSSPLPKNGFCKVWFKLAHWIPTYPPWALFARGGGVIIHHAFDIEKKYTDIISLEVIDQFKQSNYKTRGPWATLFTWAEVSSNK